MTTAGNARALPSSRWSSFDKWNYGGMKECLEGHIARLDTSALVRHAEQVLGQKFTMSEPFSAGQYWICFEMVAENGSLVIARVRLPKHPDMPATYTDEDERYLVDCEVATMSFVRQKLPRVKVPCVYAYESIGSDLASSVGAAYMLLEGFYGNTLQDTAFDICDLSVTTQEHVITEWIKVQAEIATLRYPVIDSISQVSEQGEPLIGRLASAVLGGFEDQSPYSSSAAYFGDIADAAVSRLRLSDGRIPWASLGAFVFRDVVRSSALYADGDKKFPLNHINLGTQNILIDDEFNFLAIIDWEFAQTAPWAANHYPVPFPLTESDCEIQDILKDPEHLAYANVVRQEAARILYAQKFRDAQAELEKEGRCLESSFVDVLGNPPSRMFACFSSLGRLDEADEGLVREMVRLGFGFESERADKYLRSLADKARQAAHQMGLLHDGL